MSDNVAMRLFGCKQKLRDSCNSTESNGACLFMHRAKRFVIINTQIRATKDRRAADWSVSKINLQRGHIAMHCLWLMALVLDALSRRVFTRIAFQFMMHRAYLFQDASRFFRKKILCARRWTQLAFCVDLISVLISSRWFRLRWMPLKFVLRGCCFKPPFEQSSSRLKMWFW